MSETFLILGRNEREVIKNVKYPLFRSYFNETRNFSTVFRKILKYQISWKSVQWKPSFFHADGRTDRHDNNIIIIKSIVPSRNIGCLWVLSTSVYQLLRTLVHSSFYPLPWLPIFSSYFSVFLSSCFPEGSKVGQPLVSLHPLFLMCDQSI